MSVISARVIRQPRKFRHCDQCGENMGTQPHVRLYGSAFSSDPKYVLRICKSCAAGSGDEKVRSAL